MPRRLLLPCLLLLCPLVASARITREINETFAATPDTTVEIDISGGPIEVTIVRGDAIEVTLKQRFATNSESAADDIAARYEVVMEQRGDTVVAAVKRRNRTTSSWFGGGRNRMNVSAEITCPAYVNLDLDTAGGAISVDGETTGNVRADTAGGSIHVTGGSGHLYLDTSGGGIEVERALGKLHADTSGGCIHVRYVGPDAPDVNTDTSGGGISIGVDPRGNFDLVADTSGGGVNLDGITLSDSRFSRSHAEGRMNAGGARLRADTSGGGIRIYAAEP